MFSNDRITSKLLVTLIIALSLSFAMSSCKESSNAVLNKNMVISETHSSHHVIDDSGKSAVGMEGQDGSVTNEQLQNNPPTASRPRFPTPKPSPAPTPVQGSEGGSQ